MNVDSGSDFKVPFHRGGKPVLRETLQIEGTRQHVKKRENGRRRRDRSSINFLEPGGPGTSFSARHHQERRILFVSLQPSLSFSSPILPTLYTLEYSFLGFRFYLFLSFFLSFFPPIVSTRFRESLFLSFPNSSNLRYSMSLSFSRDKGKKNKAESTDLVRENPVARIPLSIETCHVSCVEV